MVPGIVVLARFWFTSGLNYKIRPALIVSNSRFNQTHVYCLMVPFTTQTSLREYLIPIDGKDSVLVERESYIRTDGLTPILKTNIVKHIGTLSPTKFRAVVNAIRECIG